MAGPLPIISTVVSAGATGAGFLPKPIGDMVGQQTNESMPIQLPEPNELLRMLGQGWLARNEVAFYIRRHGILLAPEESNAPGKMGSRARAHSKLWDRLIDSQQILPNLAELHVMLNRDWISPAAGKLFLERTGYQDPVIVRQLLRMREQVPSPAELVHFALREGWDDDLAETWGYDKEFKSEFDYWMKYQGFIGTARPPLGVGKELSWAQMYHRTSWQVPSPHMCYQMLARLRPKRIPRIAAALNLRKRADAPDVQLKPFDLQHMRDVLKIADYPEPVRDWLAAISSSILTRVDIQRMYDLGIIDESEVYEQYLDRAYTPDDAKGLTEFVKTTSRIRRAKTVRIDTKAAVLSAYKIGVITRDQAAIRLYRLSLVDPKHRIAFASLGEPRQRDLAIGLNDSERVSGRLASGSDDVFLYSDGSIPTELALVDHAWRVSLIDRAIKAARKCYLGGRASLMDTRAELTRLQVQPERVVQYLDLWEIERDCSSRELSTAKLQSMVRDGIISPDVARVRLLNLGWPALEAELLVIEVARDVALDTARAMQARARTLGAQQKAAEQVVRAAQGVLKRAKAELARHGSPAQLRTWIARDLISPTEVRVRLSVLGWPDEDVDRAIDQALQDRLARRQKGKNLVPPELEPPSGTPTPEPTPAPLP